MKLSQGLAALALCQSLAFAQLERFFDDDVYPFLPEYGPQPNPPYMMDNQENYYGVAPDQGPSWPQPRP